jgi:hypothetical protein
MARPSYLGRREGGRYFMQIRLGKPAASLYGGPILRASLRTADFAEARRRLVDGLGWAHHLVAATDLETVGSVLHDRLTTYVGRSPAPSERMLAERSAFEHQVRHYMGHANERGFSFSRMFPGFASIWVDFVDQNKMLELTIQRIERHRAYNDGRNDQAQIGITPTAQVLPALVEPSASSQIAAIDPLQLIRSLVAESMQTYALSNQAAQGWQPQAAVASGTMATVPEANRITRRHEISISRLPTERKHISPKVAPKPRQSCSSPSTC